MPTFRPPSDLYNPQILPDTKGVPLRLFRHFQRRPQAVNVFILSDGTVVQDLATPGFNAGSVPYPWNPDNPGGPYVTYWDAHEVPTYVSLPVYVTKVFWGGHNNPVTAAEQATLTAAGYGAYIT